MSHKLVVSDCNDCVRMVHDRELRSSDSLTRRLMNRDERFLMTNFRFANIFLKPLCNPLTHDESLENFPIQSISHFDRRSYLRKWNARKFMTIQPIISIPTLRYFCSFCVIGMSINLSVSIVRTCNLISFQSTFCLNLTAEHDVEKK